MKHVNENGSLLIAVSLSTLFVSVVSYSTHAQAGEACTLQTPEAGYASRACASPFVCMNALNASESADPNLGLCLLPNDTTRNLESVSRWTNDAVPFSDCQESAEGFKVHLHCNYLVIMTADPEDSTRLRSLLLLHVNFCPPGG